MALVAFGWMTGADRAIAGELRGRVVGASAASPAVIWIDGLSGEVPSRDTPITHVSGEFRPAVSIGFVGNSFVFGNDDDVLHNTHLYMGNAEQKEISQRPLEFGTTLYNVALPKAGMEVRKPITSYHRYREETGFIQAVCNRHPGETGHVLVFDHPYAVLTGEDGGFSIPGLPSGEHEIRVWQAGKVYKRKAVEIRDDGATEIVVDEG
jgi:hypothetical protein